MANEGINHLARILEGRTKQFVDKPPILDFGSIQGDMSLLTNYFPIPIPQSDYIVCRSVAWGAVDDVFYKTQYTGESNCGSHGHGEHGEHPHGTSGEHPHGPISCGFGPHSHPPSEGGHSHPGSEGAHSHPADGGEMEHVHDVLIGPKYRWLQPGDRVLVAWVGDDACVIDIILPATVIG